MTEQNFDLFGEAIVQDELLRDKFLEPPFTVLDTKTGSWQARKRLWNSKGIKSELGRDAECMPASFGAELNANGLDKYGRKPMSGTSIFDPALTELMYRWFCPPAGAVIDPFAGGSVRGIVANYIGFKYTGLELRPEQVEANRQNAREILPPENQPVWICGDSEMTLKAMTSDEKIPLTPVEQVGYIKMKRDDYFEVLGTRGGKVRTCLALAKQSLSGLVTAGSRQSPQVNIVAHVAKYLGVRARAHTPQGELSPEVLEAQQFGAEITQHVAGYNSVIIARAREDAQAHGYTEIPFGMECFEAIKQTSAQVENIPNDVARIVIPVGSGMSLAGVLHGLKKFNKQIPVLGIVVGADPIKRLDEYAPSDWREMVTLENAGVDYHTPVPNPEFYGVWLDSIYEAKCKKFLQPNDLLWVVGIRSTEAVKNKYPTIQPPADVPKPATKQFDFLFTCPPYLDLEVYSENPADLSTMNDTEFEGKFARIMKNASAVMKDNSFAAIVVGDVRDKAGYYRDFTGMTKRVFASAGWKLYNEAVLLQPLGTAMLRAPKIFGSNKKLIKVHENVLIFYRGSINEIQRKFNQ